MIVSESVGFLFHLLVADVCSITRLYGQCCWSSSRCALQLSIRWVFANIHLPRVLQQWSWLRVHRLCMSSGAKFMSSYLFINLKSISVLAAQYITYANGKWAPLSAFPLHEQLSKQFALFITFTHSHIHTKLRLTEQLIIFVQYSSLVCRNCLSLVWIITWKIYWCKLFLLMAEPCITCSPDGLQLLFQSHHRILLFLYAK